MESTPSAHRQVAPSSSGIQFPEVEVISKDAEVSLSVESVVTATNHKAARGQSARPCAPLSRTGTRPRPTSAMPRTADSGRMRPTSAISPRSKGLYGMSRPSTAKSQQHPPHRLATSNSRTYAQSEVAADSPRSTEHSFLTSDSVARASGSIYQFYLAPAHLRNEREKREHTVWKHFDVLCSWDKGQEQFDNSILADGMRHSRLTYSWALFREHSDLADLEKKWETFKAALQVDIEDLAKWVNSLAPRSVHDYKPLMVLLQAVLAQLLKKELAFFSSRIAELEKLLKQAMAELEEEKSLNASLTEKLEIKEKSERRSTVLSKASSLLNRARINSAAEERSKLQSNLQGAVEEDAERTRKEKEREKELADMREYTSGKETQIVDLSKKLSDTDRKLKSLEISSKANNKELAELKDRDKTNTTLIERLQQKNKALELQLLQASEAGSAALLPWATYRPIVEATWAANLTTGLSTVAVPYESVVTLPSRPAHAQFVMVPAATQIHVPSSGETVEVTIPANSSIQFPPLDQDGVQRDVTIPGGTTVIFPSQGSVDHWDILVPPGTRAVPPLSENADTNPDDVNMAPPGVSSILKLSKGSLLIVPLSIRTKLTLPTNCKFLFSIGQKRHLNIPAGSVIQVPDKDIGMAILPPASLLLLPRDEEPVSETVDNEVSVPERELFLSVTPASTIKLPDVGGPFKVTVPDSSTITAPEGVESTQDVAAGSTCTISTGIPFTVMCPSGCTLTLSKGLSSMPDHIAERMLDFGIELAAVAIGGMDSMSAAGALSSDLLSTETKANILSSARPEAAYQALRRLKPELLGPVLLAMDVSSAGSLLAQFPHKEQALVMSKLGLDEHHAQGMQRQMNIFQDCSNLLRQKNFRPWKITHALLDLSPSVAARIMANSQSSRSATIMNNMSSIGFAKAAEHTEELADIASKMSHYGVTFLSEDIRSARKAELLANASNDPELLRRAKSLLQYFKQAYGLCFTLTRVDQQDSILGASSPEEEEDEEPPSGSTEEQPQPIEFPPPAPTEGPTGEYIIESTGETIREPINLQEATAEEATEIAMEAAKQVPGADLFSGSSAMMEFEDMSKEALEQRAEDSLDVVCSTEDIRWGSLVTGSADAKSLDAGLFTQMPARQLKELQEEAMEKKDLLFKGVMLIMPIMLPSGKCWGCISHILKRSACKYLLDGFPTPKVNNVPKAIQCIKLLCVGIRRSMEAIEKVRLAHEMNENELQVSEHDQLAEKRAKMGELLTKINEEKRRLLQDMMKNEKKMYSALQEIKGYANPPVVLVRVLVSLFVILRVEGFEAFLGEDLKGFADTPSPKLWKFTQGNIQLSQRHPNNLLRLLSQATKAQVLEDLTVEALQVYIDAAHHIMEPVERDAVHRASSIAVRLLDWINIGIKQANIEIELFRQTDTLFLESASAVATTAGVTTFLQKEISSDSTKNSL